MKKLAQIETTKPVTDWYAKNFQSTRQGITSIVETAYMELEKNPVVDMFRDHDQALNFMLGSWSRMWRHSLAIIKGQFTSEELSLIIDCHNGHMVSHQMYGSHGLLHNISDSMALDRTDEKWSVDPDKIKEKIEYLTPIQALCLEMWATGFWYGKNQAQGLEDYVQQLA